MYLVGDVPLKARKLVDVTYECLTLGIEQARPGNHLGDIANAIQRHAEAQRYSVVRDFCGHGVGRLFHDSPEVIHAGRPGTGPELKPGMIFTVEPMINIGRPDVKLLDDGWTAVTRDRSLSAQFEHSIGITEDRLRDVSRRAPRGLDKPALLTICQQMRACRPCSATRCHRSADIDHMGHVNNAVYLKWVQEAVIDYWRSVAPPEAVAGHLWVALKHEITYRRPTFLQDMSSPKSSPRRSRARALLHHRRAPRRGSAERDQEQLVLPRCGELRPARLAREVIAQLPAAVGLSRRGLRRRVPPRRQLPRRLDVGREIDFAPFLAVDVERPHVAALGDVVDHAQVPDGRALGRAHRAVDRFAELLGAARAEREQADRLGVDPARCACRSPQPPALLDHLHVVLVVASPCGRW